MSNKISLFGRSYTQLGDGVSDIILKTKGQIKLQYGNKFIDLIKDGKINTEFKFIYKEDEIGTKDGIYLVNDEVYLVIDGSAINLKGEVGNTYVSFLGEQKTTSDQKYQALVNIGFIHKDLESIDSLKNGIVYVESDKKLYIISNGEISEYSIANPFKNQFIIQKNDSNKGALLIKGQGINNSVAFDKLYIYSDDSKSIINSNQDFVIKISDSDKLKITNNSSTFYNDVVSSTFKSPNANFNYGFSLYIADGKSILEVDKIIVRDGLTVTPEQDIYPEYWFLNNSIINKITNTESGYQIELKYKSTYKIGDTLLCYYKQIDENNIVSYNPLQFKVLDSQDNLLTVQNNEIDLEDEELAELSGKTIFLIKSTKHPLRLSENNLDIVNDEEIELRIGDLGIGHGIYSKEALFKNARYSPEYVLPQTDNSTKFASTEWVYRKLLPIGSIIMFNGSEIPEGWSICDGTNGTPNLIDKFIKASSVNGEEGQIDYEISTNNSFKYYSLVFIMKIM